LKDEIKDSQSEADMEGVGELNGCRGVRGSGQADVQGGYLAASSRGVSTLSAAIVRLNTNCMKIEVTSRVISEHVY
jgi:hypothetical protein